MDCDEIYEGVRGGKGTSNEIFLAIQITIQPWQRFVFSECLNMMTICRYLVVKERHRMAIGMNTETLFFYPNSDLQK